MRCLRNSTVRREISQYHQLRQTVYDFLEFRNPLPNILVYAVVLEFTEKTIMRDRVKCL